MSCWASTVVTIDPFMGRQDVQALRSVLQAVTATTWRSVYNAYFSTKEFYAWDEASYEAWIDALLAASFSTQEVRKLVLDSTPGLAKVAQDKRNFLRQIVLPKSVEGYLLGDAAPARETAQERAALREAGVILPEGVTSALGSFTCSSCGGPTNEWGNSLLPSCGYSPEVCKACSYAPCDLSC